MTGRSKLRMNVRYRDGTPWWMPGGCPAIRYPRYSST
jgi:hypothetical protein